MGTNYYWYGPCAECGHLQKLHIGKSSKGWYFSLHVIPGIIDNIGDWKKRLDDPYSFIMDEYREVVALEKLMDVIKRRGHHGNPTHITPDELHTCHAELGDFNLVRFVEGQANCVGHGEGPWSHIDAEFS